MKNNQIMDIQNIDKAYTNKAKVQATVLKNLSLELFKGEFSALMGPSGVGKSTLLHIVGSLDSPDKGTIELYHNEITYNYSKMKSDEIAKLRNQKIGFVFQFSHLLPEFTALENTMMPALIGGSSYQEAKSKAENLLKRVDIFHRAEHKPMELSGGEQQRVAIARAIINDPLIILADEPTGNLDEKNANSVLDLIKELKKEFNLTFLIATHSQEVAASADRILTMGEGRILSDKKLY